MKYWNKFLPHIYALIGFVSIALIYFYPTLQGKQIFQSDIAQYTGMAKEQIDFRKEYNEEPYWTNSAFGGMPTYQLGAKYPHHYIKDLDSVIRFLPRPADYLFLYFVCFYIMFVLTDFMFFIVAFFMIIFCIKWFHIGLNLVSSPDEDGLMLSKTFVNCI